MFLDWKNQHCENEYTTQSNLQIQCNPYQNPNDIFPSSSNVKAHSQIHMELQGTLNTSKNP